MASDGPGHWKIADGWGRLLPAVINYSVDLREALPRKGRGEEVPWSGCALAVGRSCIGRGGLPLHGSGIAHVGCDEFVVGCFYVEAVVLIGVVASGSGSSGGHDLRAN